MESVLSRLWWLVALRGVLAILFGVLAFLWPGVFWLVMVATFAAYALIDGSFAIAAAVTGQGGRWWAMLLLGLVNIAAGVMAIVWPGITQLALLYLIAGWAGASGVFQILTAIRLRRYIEGEWLLATSGVLSIILGVALAVMPIEGMLAIALWVGAYSVAFGVVLLILAFRLRSLVRHVSSPGYATAS